MTANTAEHRERAALERWKPGRRWYHPLLASIVIGTSRFVMTRMNRLEVEGIERLRSAQDRGDRGLLTYSNHVSLFDDPLIVANLVSPRCEALRWVGADAINFFGSRVKSWLFTAGKCVPVVRGTGLDQPGFRFLVDRLKQRDWVHIFPEGTRTRDSRGRLGYSCKPGIGLLIEQAKPLTLPFYHAGMQYVLPVGAIVPRRGNTVRVMFGQTTDCDARYVEGVASSRTGPISGRELWQALADGAHRELRVLEDAVTGAGALPSAGSVGRQGRRALSLPELIAVTGGVVVLYMLAIWLLSIPLRNASIVDIFWGLGFVVVAFLSLALADGFAGRRILITALVTIWGLRLSLHILWRNFGKGEDYRYRAWREAAGPAFWWTSLFRVFLLQGLILWVVSMPILAASYYDSPSHFTAVDVAGVLAWCVGFTFEAVGDIQLALFKANPENTGKVMRTGLWRYTRHPNYFGDATVWWGLFLVAAATVNGLWTVFSPALMTFLLVRVSGVALLEKKQVDTRPEYRDYIESTSAFLPWFPRNGA